MNIFHGRNARLALVGTPLVALCLAGLAVAQGTRPQPAPPRAQPGQQQAAPRENLDPHLALEVALENDNEIVLAKFAQTRSDSKDIVKFAEMLEKDHQQFAQDLQRYAGDVNARREPHGNREADGRRTNPEGAAGAATGAANRREAVPPQGATAPQGQATAPRAPANAQQPGHMNVFQQIKFELADACRDSAERELQEKKGAEFDKCYLGMQLGAHMKMIDTLTVFERHSSPELQQVFHKGLQTSRKHFDEAKKLMKGVEDDVRTARRDKN